MLLKKMLVSGIKLESGAVFVRLISALVAAKENQPLIFFLLQVISSWIVHSTAELFSALG